MRETYLYISFTMSTNLHYFAVQMQKLQGNEHKYSSCSSAFTWPEKQLNQAKLIAILTWKYCITPPFNNMRNLKFKSPPKVAFLLPSINIVEVSENE